MPMVAGVAGVERIEGGVRDLRTAMGERQNQPKHGRLWGTQIRFLSKEPVLRSLCCLCRGQPM